ncbi:hypothetical protein GH733_016950 [Mirounga leonina]|nr:hypothetical protein GH733_016950 [Mirounga leonina]
MNSGRPKAIENLLALYTIFQGEVRMVTDYGGFIKIPCCQKQALGHQTPTSSCRMEKPSEIDVRDKVWVKLIGQAMKNDRIKVSLSMKKCAYKGHFAKDYFMQPGGTKYSLIPYEEEGKEEAKSAEFEKPNSMRNSSRKRKKKKKHRGRKSSDPDSLDYENDTGKRAR